MKPVVLLVGPSGCGKTTIANELEKSFGYKQLSSYTTRPRRSEDEEGHVFIDAEEFAAMKDEMCAYTCFNGYEYGATSKLVDEADVYVIDPAGVTYFFEKYKGERKPFVCFLDSKEELCRERMLARGDSAEDVEKRILNDKKAFSKEVMDELFPRIDMVIRTAPGYTPQAIAADINKELGLNGYEIPAKDGGYRKMFSAEHRGMRLLFFSGKYSIGNSTAIFCETDEGEPYCDVSVNVPGVPLNANQIIINHDIYGQPIYEEVIKPVLVKKEVRTVQFGYAKSIVIELKDNWEEICIPIE